MPDCSEIERHRFDLLMIGRGNGWRDHVGNGLRNGYGRRCQPPKLGRVGHYLPSRIAVGLLPLQLAKDGDKFRITGTVPATLSDFKIDPPSLLTIPVKNEIPVRVEMTWHAEK